MYMQTQMNQNEADHEEFLDLFLDALNKYDLEYEGTTILENAINEYYYSPIAPVLTMDELMQYLRISRPTAYELVKQEGFPAFRIGKSIRIDARKLDAWIHKQCARQGV